MMELITMKVEKQRRGTRDFVAWVGKQDISHD